MSKDIKDGFKQFMLKIDDEARHAVAKHGEFASLHEAYAVLLEEVDEVKAIVWEKNENRDYAHLKKELVQVGAVALKFYLTACKYQEKINDR